MDSPKLSERDVASDRLRIFGVVFSGLKICAIRIRFACSWKRRLDSSPGRRDNAYVYAGNSDFVAGLDHRVLRLAVKHRINVFQESVRGGRRLDVSAVID